MARHTLLDVRLETGRTHQIRVHLAAVDLPVAGDTVYGRPRELDLERQFLHAGRLAFPHPLTEKRVDVESPLPPDLEAALGRARLPDLVARMQRFFAPDPADQSGWRCRRSTDAGSPDPPAAITSTRKGT